jgi:hypothetical protein
MSESSAEGKGSVFLRMLDDLEETALQEGRTEAARVFATERDALKEGPNKAEIEESLERIERYLAVRLRHETLLLAQRLWSQSKVELGYEGHGSPTEGQFIALQPSIRSAEREEQGRQDEARSEARRSQAEEKSIAGQTSIREEQERQRRELEEIRRSFAEMGSRMGSMFEPLPDEEELKPATAPSPVVRGVEPRDQDRELEEIRRAFAEMGARMGSLFEPSSIEPWSHQVEHELGRSTEDDYRTGLFGLIRRYPHKLRRSPKERQVNRGGQHERKPMARTPRSTLKAVLRWSVNITFIAFVGLLVALLLQEVGSGQLMGIIATGVVILLYSFGAFPPRLRPRPNGRQKESHPLS